MQTVSSDFQDECNATIRQPRHNLKVAWERTENAGVVFGVVGTSTVDGNDIVQGELTVITQMDLFEFTDETDYLLQLVWERRVQEPLGGIAYALGDLLLENTSKRFTPDYDGTIGSYILPQRPVKLFTGFYYDSIEKTIPAIYGLTDQFKENKQNRTVKVGLFDYLSYINEFQLETSIYADQRSDQIIADILENEMGFSTSQFSLDTGLNTIGFAWFEKGTKAGDAIRAICEAEEGYFYQDEMGLLRFENRRHYNDSPHDTVQWTIEKDEILDWQEDETVQIINRCTVIAKPRTIQSTVEVWRAGEVIEVEHGEAKEVWADFEDPCNDIEALTATTDYKANTKSDESGSDITSDMSMAQAEFTTSAKITITNNSGGKAYITFLRLRGDPATIDNPIEEMYEDTTSQDSYGVREITIENNFIDSESFAYYLARTIVRKYKDPLRRIKILVQCVPQLQLKDRIKVKDMDTDTYTEYRLMAIRAIMTDQGFLQELTLREISDLEADCPAIVDTATVDGDCVVWV